MSTFFTPYSSLYGEKVTTFKVDTYSPSIGEYVNILKLVTFSHIQENKCPLKVITYSPNMGESVCFFIYSPLLGE